MPVKVMSLNIWNGGKLMDAAVEFINSEKPDILLLQEVYDGHDDSLAETYSTMDVLARRLDYPYRQFEKAYLEDKNGRLIPDGNAIFSMFEIRPKAPTLLSDPTLDSYKDMPEHWPILPALLQHAEVELENGWLNIFNMHGVWDLDGDSFSECRQVMSQRIIDQVKDLPAVVLAGDSNAKAGNQAMLNLENYLKPVFGQSLPTTFNMQHKDNPGYATAAVDLIYISSDIRVLTKSCPDVDISDHLPVIAVLDV